MIPSWRPLVAALVLLAACRETATPPAETAVAAPERENIATLTRGAVVIARTGETGLDVSAVQAIDTDGASFWATPPHDLEETMTIALGGDATLSAVGFSSGARGPTHLAKTLRFESSADGSSFSPLTTVTLEGPGSTWKDVPATHARFLRVTTVEGFTSSPFHLRVPTILASGAIRPSPPPSIDGAWIINGVEAWFESRGNSVRGVTSEDPPRQMEGGWDGPVLRLAWNRRNERGAIAIVADPSGAHLNGIVWYLWPHRPFFGTTWFGSRAPRGGQPAAGKSPQNVFLRSDGRYPLYGLSFAGEQLSPHSRPAVLGLASLIGRVDAGRFRLVAHYVGTETAESDRRLAAARLERLRAALREAGADPSRVEFAAAGRTAAATANDRPWTPLQIVLNNRIDLEIVSPQRR